MAINTTTATSGSGPLQKYIQWFNWGAGVPPLTGSIAFANSIPNVGNFSFNVSSIYSPIGSFGNWGASGLIACLATGYNGMVNPGLGASGTNGLGFATLTFNNFKLTDLNGNPIASSFNFIAATNDNIISGGTLTTSRFQNYYTDGETWNEIGLFTSPANSTTPFSYSAGFGTTVASNLPYIPQQGNAFLSVVAATKNPTQVIADAHAFSGGTSVGLAFGLLIDSINTSKQVSATSGVVGQVLTYTIPITNVSLDTLTNTVLLDTLPNGVTFNSGTFLIDGTAQADPAFPNITIPDIGSGLVSTISFKVTIVSVPSNNAIINNGTVTGSWGTVPASALTNQVVTTINVASLSSIKYVDKTTAVAGDILTYTIALSNTGNTTATNVILTDTVPTTTTFVTGSVTGATGTPPTLTVGAIAPGRTSTVSFKVTLGTLPNNPVINDSTANFFYYANGGTTGTTIPSSAISNTVSTSTASASITSIVKSTSENYGTIGDIITYTFNFTNTGNDTALGVTLIDTIPNGTTFVANSVYVNGVQQLGQNPAPPSGANLPNLASLASDVVTFQVQVTTVPNPNPIKNQAILQYNYAANTTPNSVLSNQAVTTINYLNITSSKIVNKAYANIGDILYYTIPITNTGNVTALDLFFTDTISNGTSYISGSLTQDGVTVIGVSSLITATLPINIQSGSTSTIAFQVKITTLPNPNPIENIANIGINYFIDATTTPIRFGEVNTNTNYAQTQINNASLAGITKAVDKNFATCGEIVTYTISIPNSGNVTAQNIILKDTLPNNTILVSNSVYINGVQQVGYNPSLGMTIPNISPLSTATLSFQVQIQC